MIGEMLLPSLGLLVGWLVSNGSSQCLARTLQPEMVLDARVADGDVDAYASRVAVLAELRDGRQVHDTKMMFPTWPL